LLVDELLESFELELLELLELKISALLELLESIELELLLPEYPSLDTEVRSSLELDDDSPPLELELESMLLELLEEVMPSLELELELCPKLELLELELEESIELLELLELELELNSFRMLKNGIDAHVMATLVIGKPVVMVINPSPNPV
jgi:hypothetical protein